MTLFPTHSLYCGVFPCLILVSVELQNAHSRLNLLAIELKIYGFVTRIAGYEFEVWRPAADMIGKQ